jgi:hypothetical protein
MGYWGPAGALGLAGGVGRLAMDAFSRSVCVVKNIVTASVNNSKNSNRHGLFL